MTFSAIVGAITAFLTALPELLSIYKSLKKLFGDDISKVASDLAAQAALVEKSNAPGLTLEQKRELRREALTAGYGMWTRIAD